MVDSERADFLLSKTDVELCNAYNHPLIKKNTEQQIERILRDRQIGRCDARSKIRTIPLSLAAAESVGSDVNNNEEIKELSDNSTSTSPSSLDGQQVVAPASERMSTLIALTGSMSDVEKVQETPLSPQKPVPIANVKSPQLPDSGSTTSVTKDNARAGIVESIRSDPDYANDPVKKEFHVCVVDAALDEIFGAETKLDEAVFESRFTEWENKWKNKDPADLALQAKKCFVKSAFRQAMRGEGHQESLPGTKSATLPLIDIDDLRLDMVSLVGKKIRTQGVGSYMMDRFFLGKNMTDMSPVLVDISKLPREQRRLLIQRCSDFISGCQVTVRGEVGKVSYQNGVIAESISWN